MNLNNLTRKQRWNIDTYIIPSFEAALNHPDFNKNVGYKKEFLSNNRITCGYWLAQNKNQGCRTDLISEKALKLNPKCNVKATGTTWDHVNGVRDTGKKVFLKYQELNGDRDKFLQWVNDNWEDMTTSIQITQKENKKLTAHSVEMSYEQKLNMEHYKALGIKLHKVNYSFITWTNYSEPVKSLIVEGKWW